MKETSAEPGSYSDWAAQLLEKLEPVLDDRQSQRLFHGRGHAHFGLEQVTVDWLPPVALITLYKSQEGPQVEAVANHLHKTLPGCTSVQLQKRYLKSGPVEVLKGYSISSFSVWEGSLKYKISLGQNRNTGLFLDMKNGRQWVVENCRNKRVLNLFSYTCGFSVAAVNGGAKSVYNIDLSRPALNVGRENHRLNEQSLNNVAFDKLDVFKSFGRFAKRGPFDLLICDPPTFQKDSVDIAKDCPKILRRLSQFMAREATLLLCLNAPNLGGDFLMRIVEENAPEYSLKTELKRPGVFFDDQGKGLKLVIFEKEPVEGKHKME